uniref:Methyltransferase PMT28 n=1 Tax=Bixa orellana TaxID=66672 RepID=A0A9Y0ZEU1_BIXOR|nr:putative methyltransferase PMT28 [Bixa orellana]
MAIARFGRQVKRPHGFCLKMTAVGVLGLCFIFIWSVFSSPSTSLTVQRESFDDIAEPVSSSAKVRSFGSQSKEREPQQHDSTKQDKKVKVDSGLKGKNERNVNRSASLSVNEHKSGMNRRL